MSEFIQSKDNSKVKEAYKAKDGKGERFLVEGFHLVEMALSSGVVDAIFTLKDYPSMVPTYLVTPKSSPNSRARSRPKASSPLCHKVPSKTPEGSRLLYLDEVRDPGNVGTLLRTALAFGFKDVILSKGSAEAYASKVLLASQGADLRPQFC
jgi:TrmH family RNA methyltransferase